MPNIAVKGVKAAGKGAMRLAKEFLGKEVIEKAVVVGADAIEKYNSRIKIPDLKDVPIDDAIKNLCELNLLPIKAIANPNVGYAESLEDVVVDCEPKFGRRVDPMTTVKVYYVTKEIISKSKELAKGLVEVFRLPRVIGLDIYEAREDLEELGLRVALKLESPGKQFISREDGQVTRVTYPDNKKLTQKQKKGERVWVYYVDENTINQSKKMVQDKTEKIRVQKERIIESINNVPKPFKKKKSED